MRLHNQPVCYTRRRESGVVSLFVVIFTAIFLTIVTVGFVQTMLRLQQQASDNDLAQSAYDSAMAGVEDAKKAINMMRQACGNSASATECGNYTTALSSGECNSVKRVVAGSAVTDMSEVLIQQDTGAGGDALLDQAYTCATVDLTPGSVEEEYKEDDGGFLKLEGEGSFDRVRISWGLPEGAQATVEDSLGSDLPRKGEWPSTRPALLRAQFIETEGDFNVTEFDNADRGDSASSTTTFLYPSGVGLSSDLDLNAFGRYSSESAPQPIKCKTTANGSANPYPCTVNIPINSTNKNVYLYLISMYAGATVKVQLYNGNTPVSFNNGYAVVDSTGRANDLFRRVRATVKSADYFPYPKAALEVESDLCKDFVVTDVADDYASQCVPGQDNEVSPSIP